MGKHRESGISATWEMNDVMIFCDICIKEIELGNRPTTYFSKDGWNNLMSNYRERTGKSYDQKQMKNKWDQLKKEWKVWRELKRGETGLGWNPSRKTIDASDEWWDERLKVVPTAKKFRYSGITPELEERLDRMFSQVVATGDLAWAPSSRNMGHESVDERDMSDDDDIQDVEDLPHNATSTEVDTSSTRPSSSSDVTKKIKDKGKKKRVGKKRAMSSTMEDITQTSRIIGRVMMEPPKIQISSALFTIPEAVGELEKHPEIMEDYDFYDYCTMFLRDKSNRETFMSIPEKLKVRWLKARYTKNSQ